MRSTSQGGKRADAIGDEIGRVLGEHDSLAQHHVAEVRDRVHHLRQRFRSGDDLQQLQVARRIEEVGAQKVPAEFFAESFDDAADGDARGVRTDDGARRTDRLAPFPAAPA